MNFTALKPNYRLAATIGITLKSIFLILLSLKENVPSTKKHLGPLSPVGLRHWNPRRNISELAPGYFSLVMATGIVSIAAHLYHFELIAHGLLYFNIAAYLWLFILTAMRFIMYWERGVADFFNLKKSPGFLSFVAGSAVLGSQFTIIWSSHTLGIFMYFLSACTWALLIYTFFTVITIAKNKPNFTQAINGSWLLIIVATQSIAVLGILLVQHFNYHTEAVLFFSLLLFLCGCMFYIIIITFITFRMSFFDLAAREFAPSYWINMGATAISVLAGSLLISNAQNWDFLISILPFLKGFTLFYWAIGTWWIPFVIIMGIWRTVLNHLPLKYHPLYWSMVFPLGMYTVCTSEMATAMELPFLDKIPAIFVYIALGSWMIAFIGMVVYYFKHPVFEEDFL